MSSLGKVLKTARRILGLEPDGGKVAKNVMNVIAIHADEAGYGWPSQAALAAGTGYTDRAIRKALAQLEAEGFIKRTPRFRRDGSRDSDGIQLCLRRIYGQDGEPARKARSEEETVTAGIPQPAHRNHTAPPPEPDSGLVTLERTREDSRERSDPNGSAPVPVAGPDFKKDLWDRSVRILRRLTKRSEPGCRALIGSWRGLVRDDATIIRTIDDAEASDVVEAVSWIEARLKRGPKLGSRGSSPPATPAPAAAIAARQVEALAMAVRGEWPIGGTVFVEADSSQGRAWAAYYAGFGVRPRWRDCGRTGYGCHMPSALPPDRTAVAA